MREVNEIVEMYLASGDKLLGYEVSREPNRVKKKGNPVYKLRVDYIDGKSGEIHAIMVPLKGGLSGLFGYEHKVKVEG